MGGFGLSVTVVHLHFLFLASFIGFALCAFLPQQTTQNVKNEGVDPNNNFIEESETLAVSPVILPAAALIPPSSGFPPAKLARPKRYVGWGRKPGLRYGKATSAFDFDTAFNKIYNKYQKRGNAAGPDAPISSFRELRMKQKVPNAQLLLPHLFNRNNRDADAAADVGIMDLNQEDIEALMYLLDAYSKSARNNNEQ